MITKNNINIATLVKVQRLTKDGKTTDIHVFIDLDVYKYKFDELAEDQILQTDSNDFVEAYKKAAVKAITEHNQKYCRPSVKCAHFNYDFPTSMYYFLFHN